MQKINTNKMFLLKDNKTKTDGHFNVHFTIIVSENPIIIGDIFAIEHKMFSYWIFGNVLEEWNMNIRFVTVERISIETKNNCLF